MIVLPPWLQGVYADLSATLVAARLPHALLIHGSGGWGETLLAEALALRLIERDSNDDAAAAVLAHPDLRWIVPEGAGEQIGIDAIRSVAEFVVRTPQIAPRKVAVFTSADAMNTHAANALLKTLEEPPPDSYLILVTDSLRDLLPTIRSRCRLVPVRPADVTTARAWVHRQLPDANAEQITALCFEHGGAPYRVVAAMERDEQPIAGELCEVALGRCDPLVLAETWSKAATPVDLIDRWLRYLLRVMGQRYAITVASADVLTAALSKATDRQLFVMWDALARDRQLLRGTTNPNARLLFETRLLAWRDLARAL